MAMKRTGSFTRNYGWLILFAVLQTAFWVKSHEDLPELGIVPDVPGNAAVKAISFGDEEFYFRLLALDLQNAGDTFGRFTELYKYDFKKLYAWFTLLDTLDRESSYIPFLASYYFAQTQHPTDTRWVVNYLYNHSYDRPEKKYWWLAQGAYIAEHKLHDRDLALKLATPLEQAKDAPFWARQLPAFVHERRGEMDDAMRIMEQVAKNSEEIPPGELNFMNYFIKERLHRLEKIEAPAKQEPPKQEAPKQDQPPVQPK